MKAPAEKPSPRITSRDMAALHPVGGEDRQRGGAEAGEAAKKESEIGEHARLRVVKRRKLSTFSP